ncbi:MAG: hypothetical protein ACM3SS_02680 [Rhodospirillaceae bacterium]
MTRLQEILDRRNTAIAQNNAKRTADDQARRDELARNYPEIARCRNEMEAIFGPVKVFGGMQDGVYHGKHVPRGVTPVLERMETKEVAPARVKKGKPATKERWYSDITEDC